MASRRLPVALSVFLSLRLAHFLPPLNPCCLVLGTNFLVLFLLTEGLAAICSIVTYSAVESVVAVSVHSLLLRVKRYNGREKRDLRRQLINTQYTLGMRIFQSNTGNTKTARSLFVHKSEL